MQPGMLHFRRTLPAVRHSKSPAVYKQFLFLFPVSDKYPKKNDILQIRHSAIYKGGSRLYTTAGQAGKESLSAYPIDASSTTGYL